MDKLITTGLGGFPLELDDLRWQFNAYEAAFKAIGNGLGVGNNFVLYGCEASNLGGTLWTVTAGVVVIQGELCECPAMPTITVPIGNVLLASRIVADDSSGTETFEDLSVQQTYQKRRAVINTVIAGSINMAFSVDLLTGAQLSDRILGLLTSQDIWHNIGDAGEPVFNNLWVWEGSQARPRFRKDVNKTIRLSGLLDGTNAINSTVFLLPAQYTPSSTVQFVIHSMNNLMTSRVFVSSAGSLSIPGIGTANSIYQLDQLPPIPLD